MKTLILSLILTFVAFPQMQNIRISNTSASSPNEVSIAINPLNPDVVVAGSNISYL